MGVKVVQQFGVSEIEGERRQVRNLIVNLPTKVMAENTAMALLVKGPSLQQIGWRSGGGYKTFDLPPHSCRIVSPGENYAVSHIKTNFNAVVVQENACHIKVRVFGSPHGFVTAD